MNSDFIQWCRNVGVQEEFNVSSIIQRFKNSWLETVAKDHGVSEVLPLNSNIIHLGFDKVHILAFLDDQIIFAESLILDTVIEIINCCEGFVAQV